MSSTWTDFSLLAALGTLGREASAPVAVPRTSEPTPASETPARARGPRAPVFDFHVVLVMQPGAAREALAMALWDAGMLVTVFGSAAEAEGVLVGEPLHAVLVDHASGPSMGPHVAWWLRAVGRRDVAVVVFGELEEPRVRELQAAGVRHVVEHLGGAEQTVTVLAQRLGYQRHGWR